MREAEEKKEDRESEIEELMSKSSSLRSNLFQLREHAHDNELFRTRVRGCPGGRKCRLYERASFKNRTECSVKWKGAYHPG